jgi:hypothetical protein
MHYLFICETCLSKWKSRKIPLSTCEHIPIYYALFIYFWNNNLIVQVKGLDYYMWNDSYKSWKHLMFIYFSTRDIHTNKPFIIEVNVNQLKLIHYIDINKRWNNHHPLQTYMKHGQPIEIAEVLANHILSYICKKILLCTRSLKNIRPSTQT